MRFIIYGAGAIGSTVGGHLHRSHHNVVLVGDPEHVHLIRQRGLRLVTPEKTYILNTPAAEKAAELTPFREGDILLLTAKSQHTLKCLGQLKNAGASRTLPIFCLQNSIGNEALATRIFDRIYGVEVSVSGIFLTPGEVINPSLGSAGFLEVGCYPSGSDELAKEVAEAFREAGFAAGVNERIMKAKAAKCLRNLGNAMGAITKIQRGKGDRREYMAAIRREAMEVWKAAGIEWEDPEEFERRTSIDRSIVMPKGYENIRNFGSSWQDLERRTGSIESEQLNGDVVKLGRLLGIRAPYNEVLWQVAEEMARNYESAGKYSPEDLMNMVKEKMKEQHSC
jgi:2-dehydropantoate 2-reductase